MNKARLEAFSDGVIAVAITIMVLGLQTPRGATLDDLLALAPQLLNYLLSFVYVGIYWVNHHHLVQAATHVDRRVLWTNLHLLFWISLIPFVTGWIASHHRDALPVACYGLVLLMCSLSFLLLKRALCHSEAGSPTLAAVIGHGRKNAASILLYALAIPLAAWSPLGANAIYVLLAALWFLPDHRFEELGRRA
ncbi:TMEM175 family protein [Herbaspirillum robiniae]|uniref:DUF1211 domain-containing protein n=1 Tax=Herbaspirillum robiniae TaxID=2014887 RepID=A0ABX2LYL7_9BURK|nr:TMEM175 family protein [Herbaspirillum robiniae]NUU03587.1 DUF1211 domain-containing protein [Herbaspirillum robiniae]